MNEQSQPKFKVGQIVKPRYETDRMAAKVIKVNPSEDYGYTYTVRFGAMVKKEWAEASIVLVSDPTEPDPERDEPPCNSMKAMLDAAIASATPKAGDTVTIKALQIQARVISLRGDGLYCEVINGTDAIFRTGCKVQLAISEVA